MGYMLCLKLSIKGNFALPIGITSVKKGFHLNKWTLNFIKYITISTSCTRYVRLYVVGTHYSVGTQWFFNIQLIVW